MTENKSTNENLTTPHGDRFKMASCIEVTIDCNATLAYMNNMFLCDFMFLTLRSCIRLDG